MEIAAVTSLSWKRDACALTSNATEEGKTSAVFYPGGDYEKTIPGIGWLTPGEEVGKTRPGLAYFPDQPQQWEKICLTNCF